jgi:hypothetical protein
VSEIFVKPLVHIFVVLVLTVCCANVIAGTEPVPFRVVSDKDLADVKRAEARLTVAKANFATAKRAYKWAKFLFIIGETKKSDFDEAELLLVIARLELLIAENRLAKAIVAMHRKQLGIK